MGFDFLRGGNAFATESVWVKRIAFEKVLEEKFDLTPGEKLSIEEIKDTEKFFRLNKNKRDRVNFLLRQLRRRSEIIFTTENAGRDNRNANLISSNALLAKKRGNQGHYKISD